MATYSIDLGVHLAVTGTAPGTLTEPRPLQIGLCQGSLNQESGAFTPKKVSSFRELLSRDILIVRTFDLSGSAAEVQQSLLAPLFLRLSCRTPTGAQTPDPWKISGSPSFRVASEESSLCFATANDKAFPCYRQVDAAGATFAPITYLVIDVTTPTTYLMKVLLNTGVLADPVYLNPYFGTDPEMVIGPYPGGG